MSTLNERGAPDNGDEVPKTPPLRHRGQALWRGFLIVAVFVFASSLLMMVSGVGTDTWFAWWTELLVVPGLFLGVAVAVIDYLRRRAR